MVKIVEPTTPRNDMHYKKYAVRTRLFALRDPKLSEQVLSVFAGAARVPLTPPPARPQARDTEK